MYLEPWIFWLILAPVAALSAIYVGYLALLLVGLVSITIGIGLSMIGDGLAAVVNGLAAWYACGLGFLVHPFRHVGPWLDYVAATTVLAALVCIAALLA